jgi:hypothetical protein
MTGMAVHLDRPPHSVRLVAWGRAPDGWHACVTWNQRVRSAAGDDEIGFAAWVPAGAVTRPSWSAPMQLPRVELPADRRVWPAPPGWPSWYAGVWEDGPLRAPPGLQVVTGAAWRRR